MTPLTLVTGAQGARREAAIAAALVPGLSTAVILEGLPDGKSGLDAAKSSHLQVARIAPGCLCCTGNLILRVTLNRILRRPPARLFIGLASADHVAQIRRFLSEPPYDALLALTDDLRL
jgi:G3E family GTPase